MRFHAFNFELNLTLQCNLACPNCNRHCDRKPAWAEDSEITVEQLKTFIGLLRDNPEIVRAKRVKLAGGEPLIHSNFPGLYRVLMDAIDEGLVRNVVIETNGTQSQPDVPLHSAIQWHSKSPKNKRHLPTLWSPTDLGLPLQYPCEAPYICGISLDNRGFLPCSMAISIVRTFGWWDMYTETLDWRGTSRKMFSTKWDMDRLCRHCVFAGPEDWRVVHCKRLKRFTKEELRPTKTWAEAMK